MTAWKGQFSSWYILFQYSISAYFLLCFSFAESSARKHRQVYIELLIISEAFSFFPFVLPLSQRFLIFKWKNHGIYEIHSSARINNRPWNRCSSRLVDERCAQNFFNLCQNIKDDTWDVMRDDMRGVGGERRDSNQSSCAINNFGGFCGGASDEITGSHFTLN